MFATAAGGFAVVRRDPASVIGDGVSTVRKLAEAASERRRLLKERAETSLCPIELDREAEDHLRANGIPEGFLAVPAAGERVFLRHQSNLAKGGVAVDRTAAAHPGVRALAAGVLAAFRGLPCVGIDLLCADIAAPPEPGNHAVIEVNSNPGLAMHAFPGEGEPRDVTAMLVDAMFPWLPAVTRPAAAPPP